MELGDWFSIPMILSQIVVWILWSFLQLAIGSEINRSFQSVKFLFIVNFIFGVVYHIKKVKRQQN